MKQADELRARMAQIRSDIDALEQQEETSEEDHVRLDALLADWDQSAQELAPLEEREQRIAEVRARGAVEANRDEPFEEPASTPAGPTVITRTKRDPYADLDSVRTQVLPPQEIRSRALTAIDQYHGRTDHWALPDDAATEAARKVEKMGTRFGTAVARQMLLTGSSEYLASFEQYVTDPTGYQTRAAMSLTPANGGYLVPFTLDPTIILTNAGSANPYRQVATVKTTATNDWNGVTSAGVTAAWTAEGIEATDGSPTVGQLKITPQKATAYLFGSFEVLGDSDIGQQLPELLADAKDRLEETAFAVGTGTGQPKGVIPAGTTTAAATGTAATGPTAASVYTLSAALPARWRGPGARVVWLAHLNAINTLRNQPKFTGATEPILQDNANGTMSMLGRPVLESTSVVGTYANGAKVLAYLDARQYYIVDRVGMSVVYDPLVLGANRIPTGQGAWYAFWRVGADVSTAAAVRVLTLTT
jgi:HK97 family phage major capsid protein